MALKTMSNTYQIRVDEAVRIPKEIQDLLNWKVGDDLKYTIDIDGGKLILTKEKK
jgi:bifunctional DNA-binding transcriptional regulator/antitoxin component of YhaV-PrlF toxin-antitoxin module